jgi:hypothetical protein
MYSYVCMCIRTYANVNANSKSLPLVFCGTFGIRNRPYK